ncbi:uncharacterized protein KY384_007303 [Bacidia gigantensis]|uniref:uncharacterized protein n=1 Tax=Bacidia gigantensis TaxID=2732470 RepID=UPI001D04C2CC|nr:uncharacterized protein KY384_007303 [Bacidia gigantensis]KAG8528385.1 hypothetical protein KY384_007303 [Bacidia gigantensis]
MYSWYQQAGICYAYLSDLHVDASLSPEPDHPKRFIESKWFTRGWTLQELLAPDKVTFYDAEWNEIGNKEILEDAISLATGIERRCLNKKGVPGSAARNLWMTEESVATRMSWASSRETSRVEDMAYCLLGLFDVNMPLLYGEGEKAFVRLQHEIIRGSDDESIFAWTWAPFGLRRSGILAPHPSAFKQSANIVTCPRSFYLTPNSFHEMTNKGLRIQLPVVEEKKSILNDNDSQGSKSALKSFKVALACRRDTDANARLCIYLEQEGNTPCFRVKPDALDKFEGKSVSLRDFYITSKITIQPMEHFRSRVSSSDPPKNDIKVILTPNAKAEFPDIYDLSEDSPSLQSNDSQTLLSPSPSPSLTVYNGLERRVGLDNLKGTQILIDWTQWPDSDFGLPFRICKLKKSGTFDKGMPEQDDLETLANLTATQLHTFLHPLGEDRKLQVKIRRELSFRGACLALVLDIDVTKMFHSHIFDTGYTV